MSVGGGGRHAAVAGRKQMIHKKITENSGETKRPGTIENPTITRGSNKLSGPTHGYTLEDSSVRETGKTGQISKLWGERRERGKRNSVEGSSVGWVA